MDYRQAVAHALEQIPERTQAAIIADEVFYEDLLELGIDEEMAANVMLRYADARITTSGAVLDRATEYSYMMQDEEHFLDYATKQIRRDERRDILARHSVLLYISLLFNAFLLLLVGYTHEVFRADAWRFFNGIGRAAISLYRDLMKSIDATLLVWLILLVISGTVGILLYLSIRWFVRTQSDRYSLIVAVFSLAAFIFLDNAIGQIGNVFLLWLALQIAVITVRGIMHRVTTKNHEN